MSLDVHRVPSTTGQFDSGISQHVEVSSATRLPRWANQRHFRNREKMNFQFGANLADQNVAAKNAKAISDGKFITHLGSTVSQLRLVLFPAVRGCLCRQEGLIKPEVPILSKLYARSIQALLPGGNDSIDIVKYVHFA